MISYALEKIMRVVLMKWLFLLLSFSLLFATTHTFAYTSQSESLEVIMKSFSFEYRQAVESDSIDVTLRHVHLMQQKIDAAMKAPLRDDKAEQFLQGFQKVSSVLQQVELALTAGDQQLASDELVKIDQLRIEYHRLRKRSIWQLLFGR